MNEDNIFSRIVASARDASLAAQVETEAHIAADRVRRRAERLERYRETLPDDDYARVLHGTVDSEAWSIVSRFLEAHDAGRVRFLWLCGGPGTGKTVAFANVVADRGGLIVYGPELIRAFRGFERDAGDLRHAAKRAAVLVLDDLGTSEAAIEEKAVLEIVNARQGRGCLTLITGNHRARQVREMDGRIVSRIQKQGAIVELGGDDLRRGQR